MKRLQIITVLAFCLISLVVMTPNAFAWGNLKDKIQKELDDNPFLKRQGIMLRVTDEQNGYVTIGMYSGNRSLREKINEGTDILTGQIEQQWFWGRSSQQEKETVKILRRTINYIKKMDNVKEVLLTSSASPPDDFMSLQIGVENKSLMDEINKEILKKYSLHGYDVSEYIREFNLREFREMMTAVLPSAELKNLYWEKTNENWVLYFMSSNGKNNFEIGFKKKFRYCVIDYQIGFTANNTLKTDSQELMSELYRDILRNYIIKRTEKT